MVITMFKSSRTDLAVENNINNESYRLITYDDLLDSKSVEKKLIKELKNYINKNYKHIFVVGLGNENNTADSVGPKVIKKLRVNAHLQNIGIKNEYIISALEPGVLGTTGIETTKIIKSITDKIKPNLVILIDSYVTKDFKYLNKSIQITDEGIIPGSGLNQKNEEISFTTLKVPTIVIGVVTAIEIKNKINYIVSTKNVDYYVDKVSDIISNSLNKIFYP